MFCSFWGIVLHSIYETKRKGVGLMSDDNEKEPLQNNFFVRVGFLVMCLIVLYYMFSPYQNCMRQDYRTYRCISITSW